MQIFSLLDEIFQMLSTIWSENLSLRKHLFNKFIMYKSSTILFAFVNLHNQYYLMKFTESMTVEEWPGLAENHASGRLEHKHF